MCHKIWKVIVNKNIFLTAPTEPTQTLNDPLLLTAERNRTAEFWPGVRFQSAVSREGRTNSINIIGRTQATKQGSDPGFSANIKQISLPHSSPETVVAAVWGRRWIFPSVFSIWEIIQDCTELPPQTPYQNYTVLQETCSSCLSGTGIIQFHLSPRNHEGWYQNVTTLCTHYSVRNLLHSLASLMSIPPANFCCKCIHRWDMPTGSVSTLSFSLKNCSPAGVYLSHPFTETLISLLSFVLPG